MKEFILSLVAGWIVGVLFGWLKLPLPAPPLMGFVGALGILGGVNDLLLRSKLLHRTHID
jgi:XapX domain-containing protein